MHRPTGQEPLKQIVEAFRKALQSDEFKDAIHNLKRAGQAAVATFQKMSEDFKQAIDKEFDDIANESSVVCVCPANAPEHGGPEHIQKEDCLCPGCGYPLNEGSHGGNVCA